MTAPELAGDRIGSIATGVSAGAGLSGGVERSMNASNASATPPGSTIQTRLRKAEKIEPRDCWTRGSGWRGGSGGLPCHSHKPDRWFSSLGEVLSDITISCPLKRRNAVAIDKLTRYAFRFADRRKSKARAPDLS
jgi:hypothetical protein